MADARPFSSMPAPAPSAPLTKSRREIDSFMPGRWSLGDGGACSSGRFISVSRGVLLLRQRDLPELDLRSLGLQRDLPVIRGGVGAMVHEVAVDPHLDRPADGL